MKKLLLFLLFIPNLAFAQVTQQEVLNNIASNLPTNNANEISALALRNTLGYMTSAIFEGVPPQSGTVCPPPTGLFPYQFFINTNGSPTNIVYNIFDGVSCVQWGVLNQTAHTFQGLFGGGLEVSGPLSASGPFSAAPTQFLSYLTQGPTGNIGGLLVNLVETGTTNANQTQWNQFNCIDAFSDTGGHPANNCVAINHVLNSTLVEGGRQALGVILSLNSPTNPANSLAQYVAVVGEANAVSGDQGTSLTPRGILYASNFITTILPTSTYLYGAVAGEDDISIETSSGTAPGRVAIRNFVAKAAHAAHGQMYDGGIVLSGETGTVGMLNGVLFSCHFNDATCSQGPVASTGTLMATEGSWTVANGIDLSSVTISTCSLKLASGCIVDGNGSVSIGNPLLPVTSLQNPDFGSNSLTSVFVNGVAASATLPETGIQSIINSSLGGANVDTAFKIAVFGHCGASTGSADCYGGNFVTTLQSGLASNVNGIALEADVNCNNANYGDAAGVPTLPFCVPLYTALGPSSMRSTALMMGNVSGPTNRGLVFFSLNAQQIRYNVIEDYSTVTIGGLINASGHYPGPAAIDFNAATGMTAVVRAPNNVPYSWRNAANSADISPINLDGSNVLNLGTGAAGLILNTAAAGTIKLQVNGAGVGDYGSTVGSSWFFSPNMFLNGIISMQANSASTSTTTGTLRVTGGMGLTGAVTLGALLQVGTIYSAAGTPLPSCAAGTDGASAVVSDATGATYAGTYTSGGAQKRRVLCVNGTGWITN